MQHKTGLLWIAAAAVILFLLSISLHSVQFLPGRPFSLGESGLGLFDQGGNASMPGGDIALGFIRVILALMFILLPICIIAIIKSPDLRRRFLGNLFMLALIFIVARLIIGQLQEPDMEFLENSPLAERSLPEPPADLPAEVFSANTPDWLVTAVSLLIALALIGVVVLVARALWQRRRKPVTALEQLASQAQETIDAIQAGGELRDAVLRCYRDMSQVLQRERGLRRSVTMTAREFEQALSATGIPEEPVHQLTRLFEQVRYGHQHLGHAQEQQAVASLSAIVAACQPGPAV